MHGGFWRDRYDVGSWTRSARIWRVPACRPGTWSNATTSCRSRVASAYADRGRAAGDDVELDVDPRADHYEHPDPGSRAWRAVREWLDRRLT
jgi:hypothetical protein